MLLLAHWLSIILATISFSALIYTYVSTIRVLARLISEDPKGVLAAQANEVRKKRALTRLIWVKGNHSTFPPDIRRLSESVVIGDRVTCFSFACLVVLWIAILVLGPQS